MVCSKFHSKNQLTPPFYNSNENPFMVRENYHVTPSRETLLYLELAFGNCISPFLRLGLFVVKEMLRCE